MCCALLMSISKLDFVLLTFNFCDQIFQIFNAKLGYLGLENLLEWTIYITALLFIIDFDQCERDTGLRRVDFVSNDYTLKETADSL